MANYLYNGVELPALPEWDKEKYPYALLGNHTWLNDKMRAQLVCYSEKAETGYNDDGDIAYWVVINGTRIEFYIVYPINTIPSDWGNPTEYTGSANRSGIWSNTDIYLDDGTLYLAASDPVPVLSLTERDLYRKINGKPTKLTLYKKLGGKLVPLDEHTKEVKT